MSVSKRWGRKNAAPISPATVNRSTTEVVQKLFTRAKKKWGARFDKEPDWRDHILPEVEEHVRELRNDDADKLALATRHDYTPFFCFARASALRLRECLLKRSDVDWDSRMITKRGKGGRTVTAPITAEVEAIVSPLVGDNEVWVFTYVAKRTRGKRVKGRRYPVTLGEDPMEAFAGEGKGSLASASTTSATTSVPSSCERRVTLKLVQRALNHANIKTTTRYAHVLADEVADTLEDAQKSNEKKR